MLRGLLLLLRETAMLRGLLLWLRGTAAERTAAIAERTAAERNCARTRWLETSQPGRPQGGLADISLGSTYRIVSHLPPSAF